MDSKTVKGNGTLDPPSWNNREREDLWDALQEEILDHGLTREELTHLHDEIDALRTRLLSYGEHPFELGLPRCSNETQSGLFTAATPLSDCSPFPESVYGQLPRVLSETTGFYTAPHERDICLLACLGTLSSCMPNVKGLWGRDVPLPHGSNLFVAIIAEAAGGKSAIRPAKMLVSGIHRHIRKQSQRQMTEWENAQTKAQAADVPFRDPKPAERGLYVPANTSHAFLVERLAGQDGRGLVFSTEIDTWVNANGQDWGQFDDFARKAYHHEASEQGRKSSGLIEIERPYLSLVLAGTINQFVSLIQSPENGLYSRFCVYHSGAHTPFLSQRPNRKGMERQQRLSEMAEEMTDLFKALDGRPTPLQFEVSDASWDLLQQPFRRLHWEAKQHGYTELISIPRRAALWAFRIAMVLTVLNAHHDGVDLQKVDRLEANLCDVETAVDIALTCAEHSIRFARARLGLSQPSEPADRRIAIMLRALPDEFGSGQAYAAAETAGIDAVRRTLRRDLKRAHRLGLIEKQSARTWRKTKLAPME